MRGRRSARRCLTGREPEFGRSAARPGTEVQPGPTCQKPPPPVHSTAPPLRKSTLLQYYEAIEQASLDMLEAARVGNWDRVVKLEGACAVLISQLKHAAGQNLLASEESADQVPHHAAHPAQRCRDPHAGPSRGWRTWAACWPVRPTTRCTEPETCTRRAAPKPRLSVSDGDSDFSRAGLGRGPPSTSTSTACVLWVEIRALLKQFGRGRRTAVADHAGWPQLRDLPVGRGSAAPACWLFGRRSISRDDRGARN